jgi:hypothetical protein
MSGIYDGPWRLIDHDPVTDRTVWMIYDHNTGECHYRVDYPVENLIGVNKEMRALRQHERAGDFTHVASVPLNIYHDSGLAESVAQGDEKFTKRFLNDGDNAAWRTKEGKL